MLLHRKKWRVNRDGSKVCAIPVKFFLTMKKFLQGMLLIITLTGGVSISSCSENDFQQDGGSYIIEASKSTDPSEDPTGSGSGSTASDSTQVGG